MLDRLTSMRIFRDAATLGSISAAARQANISPAMASRHIDALESHLRVQLLLRSTRKLVVTEVGLQYLESCRYIIETLGEMEAKISADHIDIAGRVRINAPLSFGKQFLAPIIPKLLAKHPGLSIDMHLTDSQHDILSNHWDVTVRIGQLRDSNFYSRKLGDCRLHICAAPNYWQKYGRPTHAQDLTQHNCLSYTLSNSQSQGVWLFGSDGSLAVPISGSFTANNGDALVAAAEQGLGVIYQPDFIVTDALARNTLESIRLKELPDSVGGIHVIFNDRYKISARIRATIDFLAEHFD